MRSLGYRVRTHVVRSTEITLAMRKSFQISSDGDWQPSFPSPSAYVPGFFSCQGGFSNGYVCDRALDRLLQRAQALQSGDGTGSAAVWTQVDRMVSDRAYWVPTVTVRALDVTSKRLHGYQFHPIWNFIADQSWVTG